MIHVPSQTMLCDGTELIVKSEGPVGPKAVESVGCITATNTTDDDTSGETGVSFRVGTQAPVVTATVVAFG